MNRTKILGQRLFIWLCFCGLMPAMTQAAQIVLSNDVYLVRVLPDGAVELKAQDTAPQIFAPSFIVLSRADANGEIFLDLQVEADSFLSVRRANGDMVDGEIEPAAVS